MNDTFVPLATIAKSAAGSGFTALEFKPGPPMGAKTAGATGSSDVGGRALQNCGEPVVTLQREGDTVTSIRVECTCGKVIELNCAY